MVAPSSVTVWKSRSVTSGGIGRAVPVWATRPPTELAAVHEQSAAGGLPGRTVLTSVG